MRNVHCVSDAHITILQLNLFQCSQIWCCFHEYGATLLTPASSSGSTPASPLSSPLLGEPWLGQCRWKGPPLRAMALTACEGPAWVS